MSSRKPPKLFFDRCFGGRFLRERLAAAGFNIEIILHDEILPKTADARQITRLMNGRLASNLRVARLWLFCHQYKWTSFNIQSWRRYANLETHGFLCYNDGFRVGRDRRAAGKHVKLKPSDTWATQHIPGSRG